jgi:uncharacterized protein YceK
MNRWVETALVCSGLAAVFVSAFVGPGCGTLMNQEKAHPRIYGGVREDLRYFPVSVIDLPCSAVGDTIMLPWDIRSRSKEKTSEEEKSR